MNTNIKITVAGPAPITRKGIVDVLNQNGFSIITTCSSINLIKELRVSETLPHVCIIDTDCNTDDFDVIKRISRSWPSINTIVFTSCQEEYSLLRAIAIGSKGYLLKNASIEELAQAVYETYTYGYYFSNFEINEIRKKQHAKLTQNIFLGKNEVDFLKLCCTELTYKEIANVMNVSLRFVDACRDELFAKLSVRSRIGLVAFAFKNGLMNDSAK